MQGPRPPHRRLCPRPTLMGDGAGAPSVGSGPNPSLTLSCHAPASPALDWLRPNSPTLAGLAPSLAPCDAETRAPRGAREGLRAWLLLPGAQSLEDARDRKGGWPLCVPAPGHVLGSLGPPCPAAPLLPAPRRRASGVGPLPWELCIGIYFETVL